MVFLGDIDLSVLVKKITFLTSIFNKTMPFRFLEEVAIADAAFEVSATTIEELFCEAARALMEIIVDTNGVEKKEERIVNIEREDLESLLYAFLSEIIFLKDTESMLFGDFASEIKRDQAFHLTSRLYGEPIDKRKHNLRGDIKAVTYYLFSLRQEKEGWKATVVVDM